MANTYYFFDSQPIYQAEWVKTIGNNLLNGVICGIGNDLFPYADASGMQVKVKDGACHIKGNYFFSDDETILAISPAPTTPDYMRFDYIVVEVNWTAKNMSLKIVEGEEGSYTAPPELTRSSTIWQIPIGAVIVNYGDTNVSASNVVDLRDWALGVYALPFIIGTGQSVITTGRVPVPAIVPGNGKIIGYEIVADVTGSIVIDLWSVPYNMNASASSAHSICNTSYKVSLSSASYANKKVWYEPTYINGQSVYWDNRLAVWDTDLAPYNLIIPKVDSVATIKQVNLTLMIARMVSSQE